MTPEQLEALWQRGQQQEAEGSLDAARVTYMEILAGSPRQIMVQIGLSELEQRAGHYRAARKNALEAAETITLTKRWEGLAYVTANLLLFDERELVRSLVLQSDWNDVRVMRQSAVLSQQLWLCGDEEAALRMLDIAKRQGAVDHRLAYSRAIALQHLGRIAEATAAFEECLRIEPGYALAHWSLAYHAPSDPPGARVARIRSAAGQDHDQFERAMLHYALYKELDDAGDHEAAWAELDKGAAIMRLTLGYSAHATAAEGAANPWEADARPGAVSNAGYTPIFIVGMPRTGTTLLSRIVGAHPLVADAGELNALEHSLAESLDRFVEFPLKPDDIARLRGVDSTAVADGYMRRTRGYYTGNATHLIDKNPMNVFAAGVIAGAMPNARILCLVRGAMDACYSNLRQLFQNGTFAYSYDQRQLAEHYAGFQQLVEQCQARLPANFLPVSYESLVEAPIATAKVVMEFCGLGFDPAYVDITRNLSPSATASSTQIREPIHTQALGEWRRYEDKLQPLQACLHDLGVAP